MRVNVFLYTSVCLCLIAWLLNGMESRGDENASKRELTEAELFSWIKKFPLPPKSSKKLIITPSNGVIIGQNTSGAGLIVTFFAAAKFYNIPLEVLLDSKKALKFCMSGHDLRNSKK